MTPIMLSAICKWRGEPEKFYSAMLQTFLEPDGEFLVAHQWNKVNASLLSAWGRAKYGKLGGRPVREPARLHPRTLEEPDKSRVEKIREDKNKSTPQPPNDSSPSARRVGVPLSDEAKRIGAIYHRNPLTPWSEKERKAWIGLRAQGPLDDDELSMIERCYASQWPPAREKNMLRHDLCTFLNNYRGEADRARIWCAAHTVRSKTVKFEIPESQREDQNWTPEQIEENKRKCQALKAELAEKLKGGPLIVNETPCVA